MVRLAVAGTGRYLPKTVRPNSFFLGRPFHTYNVQRESVKSKFLTEQCIVNMTGVRERRRAPLTVSPSDMGYFAATQAIERSGITVDSLVGIILATVTEDQNYPSGAIKIQKRLGARGCHFAYDAADACAGFPEVFMQAHARAQMIPGNYLVVASECLSRSGDPTDINSTLFGDGAGAAVLVPCEDGKGIAGGYSKTDPFDGKCDLIFRDDFGFLRMPDGSRVLREATREMVDCAKALKGLVGWDRADVYIPHQANARIIQQVRDRVAADGAIVYENVDRYGNMSAATCAVALDECLREGVISAGNRVIMTAFGAGLVTSGVALQF